MNSNSDDSTQTMVLYVKAGSDGKRIGACPFCQRVLMILMAQSAQHSISFQTVAVDLTRPPEEFRKKGLRHLPALENIDDQVVIDNIEEIGAYLEKKYDSPGPGFLTREDSAANMAVKDLFSAFCFYIKDVSKDAVQLESELKKLNSFLEKNSSRGRFLCGDTISHLDCEFLPKLQHVRVASEKLKQFKISINLTYVWAYLFAAYNCDVFVRTCPSDEEILLHWLDRPGAASRVKYVEHKKLIHGKPTFSFDVPAVAILITLD